MNARGRHGQSNKMTCPRQHRYDELNTRTLTSGARACRICQVLLESRRKIKSAWMEAYVPLYDENLETGSMF